MASVSVAVVGLGGSLLGDRPAGGELDREARFAMACAGRRVRSFVRHGVVVGCWVLVLELVLLEDLSNSNQGRNPPTSVSVLVVVAVVKTHAAKQTPNTGTNELRRNYS